jgi:hypothetical protein
MKINIKPKAEPTVQRNLRVPISLNKQMNETTALADELGVDYHATLLAALEQFNIEFDARLREMKAKGERPTTSGITAGSESIPAPVEQHSQTANNIASTSATKAAAPSLADLTPPDSAMASSNGLQKEPI